MTADLFEGHPSQQWRSVGQLLDVRAAENPLSPAVSLPEAAMSYRELTDASILSARCLLGAGVAHGDRVGIFLREASGAYVSHALGCLRLGAICVTVNARNKMRELTYVVRHSGMRLLITAEEMRPVIEATTLPPELRVVYLDVADGWPALADAADVHAAETRVGRDDTALLLYTSGTTADPKGCLHSHATLLAEGENCSGRISLGAADRFWTPLPLFHVGGWQVLMSTLTRGACFSHVGSFEPTRGLDQLEREKVTHAFPAFELIWLGILGHPRFSQADLSALRLVMNVGTPERLRAMQTALPWAAQVSCFGMTESCGSICLGSPSDPLESRLTSSGRPMPGIEITVVDPDSGEPVAPGEAGEFRFRGVTRFRGYWQDPQATAAAIDAEGWCRSGDFMRANADGTVTFMTRMKELLKVGGENVSTADIEDYLIGHPDIAVVAVVGARDARYGEVPVAFIQCHPGRTVIDTEVIEYCVGQIATYKVPRYVRVVDRFPTTPTEKIKKFVLRQQIEAELDEAGVDQAPAIRSRRAEAQPERA